MARSPWAAAVSYIARRDRSEAEMKSYLEKKGHSQCQIRETIERLHSVGLLDDRKLAEKWLSYCLRNRPVGRLKFSADLLSRGISREITDSVASQLDAETERELARQLIERRRGYQWKRDKFYRFLAYRGFNPDIIMDLWRRLPSLDIHQQKD